MSLNQRTDKENAVHLHTTLKNSDIRKLAGKLMELENIILTEVTQTQKDKHGVYLLINGIIIKIKEKHATTYRPREAM